MRVTEEIQDSDRDLGTIIAAFLPFPEPTDIYAMRFENIFGAGSNSVAPRLSWS